MKRIDNKCFTKQIRFADGGFWINEYAKNKKSGNVFWDDSVYANRKIHSLLNKHLLKGSKYKILEVGCYPGSKLMFFKKHFNYSIYGVELIKKSVEKTKANLKKFGIKGNIIHSDFFDKSFLKKHKSYFNVILDYGFSEHFENFDEIVSNYSKLLKKTGHVIIIIPNLGGVYKKLISKNLLKKHNLDIMNISLFEKIINTKFNKLFCGYVGSLYTDSSQESNIPLLINNKFIGKFLLKLFKLLNKTMIYLKPKESRMFSPYLMYVGRKK